MSRRVQVYRSSRTPEMYLYVDAAEDLARVPEALLARFGKPVPALALMLDADRRLARVEAVAVLEQIESNGYFLQLPPPPDTPPEARGTPETPG